MKIVCIGAGASGLFFSIIASRLGHEVTLLESNDKVGRKLMITGKGRCNITNNCPNNEVIEKTITNPKFLYSALSSFGPKDTIEWFSSHGCELKTERGNRVFPISDKASDIVDTLLTNAKNSGVKILYKQKVYAISKEENGFKVVSRGGDSYCDKVVIATGGKSYPLTGSTGDGYFFAKQFGHTITPLFPALCPIKIKEEVRKQMLSLTLKNVALTAKEGKFRKTIFGDMEFLPGSISGPISLSMSSLINKLGKVELRLDFKPALDEEKLKNRILREIEKRHGEDVGSMLESLLPYEIIDFFAEYSNTLIRTKLSEFTKSDRNRLIENLKRFPLTYNGLESIDKGIITSGGVNVREVDSKTMESKLTRGVYFIGEVLDVDAFTGGYNLQIALSTAYAAATHLE
ncbi:MAG: NAD(P)/FAD-dependent oxidoreductase [Bacilli bacterium]|nr:NAD(P)/FAD-dependent oxidoreductase [Bacilli bacterium]